MAVSPTQSTKTCSIVLLINHGSSSGALDQILGQISLTFKVVVQALPPIAIPPLCFPQEPCPAQSFRHESNNYWKTFQPWSSFQKREGEVLHYEDEYQIQRQNFFFGLNFLKSGNLLFLWPPVLQLLLLDVPLVLQPWVDYHWVDHGRIWWWWHRWLRLMTGIQQPS